MHDSITSTPLAWPIDAACRRGGFGRTTLYRLIKEGEIRPIKIGRRTLIPESELQRLIFKRLDLAPNDSQ